MTLYTLDPADDSLHGYFSMERAPILTINPGDTVRYSTLDAGWGIEPFSTDRKQRQKHPAMEKDPMQQHALMGPVAINGAKKGMTLEINIGEIRTGTYGWTMSGGMPIPYFEQFGVDTPPNDTLVWTLDPDNGTATTHSGYTVALKPFMGVMGMPPDRSGNHPTFPPRFCGGNLDCKELVSGSTLYLPIPVNSGLFSVGDGHGAQGDGEISWTAIECPMERVDLTFNVRDDLPISNPCANTPNGWLTMGFGMSVDQAMIGAINGMLDLMMREYRMTRKDALGLASVVVDLRITQIVNTVVGVHALLPHGAFQSSSAGS